MGFVANLFGYVLNFIYNLVHNYGLALILFTIFLKIILLPLTVKQEKSTKASQKMQKELEALKFKYKNDTEKLNAATVELYKREKFSPFTGCLAAILQFVSASGLDWAWVRTAQELLSTTAPTGIALYALLIILFTFFYTFVQINPEKAAENLQKSGAYIHGVRPGKGTEEYMSKLLRRLATVGSLFLGVISILPIVAKDVFGLSEVVAFGGTSLLIIISTGIEGIKQLEGYLLKRKYVGFMNTTE